MGDAKKTAEDTFKDQLRSRASRLLRLLDLAAPDDVLAREAFLIFRAANAVDPAAMGRLLGEFIAESTRVRSGRCASVDCANGEIDTEQRDLPRCKECEEEEAAGVAASANEFTEFEKNSRKDN